LSGVLLWVVDATAHRQDKKNNETHESRRTHQRLIWHLCSLRHLSSIFIPHRSFRLGWWPALPVEHVDGMLILTPQALRKLFDVAVFVTFVCVLLAMAAIVWGSVTHY